MRRRVEVLTSSVRFKVLYSYENTFNEKTGEWHPHIHMFALVDNWIDQQVFQNIGIALLGIRWLSTSVGQKRKRSRLAKRLLEVCKYALKFGDLSVEKDLGSV